MIWCRCVAYMLLPTTEYELAIRVLEQMTIGTYQKKLFWSWSSVADSLIL